MLSVGSSRKLSLELFPFISLFLCVIGVLAFLQNLLVIGEIGASEEEASQPQIFQTAFRIDCLPDRIILYPPETELLPVFATVSLEEQDGIRSIQSRRIGQLPESGGIEMILDSGFDNGPLQLLLNEVSTLNRLAKQYGLPYEEYVLLNVHSGGSDVYHYLLLLLDLPQYRHIRAGLDVAPVEGKDL